jgi:hypothetical protein
LNKPKCELKIDWASHEAAKYACKNWHYSKSMPCGKIVKLGVWENEKYIGVILFSRGANKSLGSPFGLSQFESCELTRVALTKHLTQVSKILSISLKVLKNKCKNLKLVVSYADPNQNHHGGIYQATNWIYVGPNPGSHYVYRLNNGKIIHPRTASSMFGSIKNAPITKIVVPKKHVYVMPLDEETRKRIIPLSKPYPKRASSKDNVATVFHTVEGGAIPTDALHLKENNKP